MPIYKCMRMLRIKCLRHLHYKNGVHMLDIKFVRENKKQMERVIENKGFKVDLVKILKLDEERRELLQQDEELRAERNKVTKLGKKGISQGKKIKKELQKLEPKLAKIEKEFKGLIYQLPNPAAKDVPVGKNEEDNVVIRKVSGVKCQVSGKAIKDHVQLGKNLDLIDSQQAAKVSGSRFTYLKNEAVLLQFALINWVVEILLKEKFIPLIPPVLEKLETARGTGYFEALSDDAYHLKQDPLVLVGTSEQTIIPYHMDQILAEKELPKRYFGYSSCFRREAGSYGKDVWGILRQHQFDKLEMISFSRPEDSDKEHEYLLSLEEKIMKELRIPYQVSKMCTGDLGLPAVRKYDIEAWLPSQKKYRETHSTSSCSDFQARRLNIKYRQKNGQREFVHTLNGTAVAIGRMLVAIMENYQKKDGSIAMPKVLQKYCGFKEIKR